MLENGSLLLFADGVSTLKTMWGLFRTIDEGTSEIRTVQPGENDVPHMKNRKKRFTHMRTRPGTQCEGGLSIR